MPMNNYNFAALRIAGLVCLLSATLAHTVWAQEGATDGQWRAWGADAGNTRYSNLGQINASNFSNLEIAWRFRTNNLGPFPEYRFQSTPLMVDGVLYTTAGSRRSVVAMDPGTGEMLWMYRRDEGRRGANAPRQLSGRGLSYWSDGDDRRIIYVTPGYQLIALDADSGQPIADFGNDGVVDLKQQLDQDIDPLTADIGLHSTPAIAGGVIIIGAAHSTSAAPATANNVKGYVRGYDVRTGERKWIFHTVPKPGDYGYDTWLDGSAETTGNTGVWAQISVDEELGLAYLPVELPTGDYYGGHRPGYNVFGESLVAVDIQTGERVWHYQLVHHGIWDYDIPSAPILTDIEVDGKPVKALAQTTKQAFLYVLDRETGVPIWPFEERPVPRGDVPGEWYAPTQPHPVRPPAYDRQGVTEDDLIDFTPELRAEALEIAAWHKMGPLFTPPVLSDINGPLGTLMAPSTGGGTNWPGGAYDPTTNTIYVYSASTFMSIGLVPPYEGQSDLPYVQGNAVTGPRTSGGAGSSAGGGQRDDVPGATRQQPVPDDPNRGPPRHQLDVQGLPLLKPPYGRITAIDMDRGEIAWQVPHGATPDRIRNHPALSDVEVPRTGQSGMVGVLVTDTLVIGGEPRQNMTSLGIRGAMLRAYNKQTGSEVGAVYMPAPQTGSPMTYEHDGDQYIVIAVSGAGFPGELIAYRLQE